MDLNYPPAMRGSLQRLGGLLAQIDAEEELSFLGGGSAWEHVGRPSEPEPSSPLMHVAAFRLLGAVALPLPELLRRTGLSYLPDGGGAAALGWPDARAPWLPGDELAAEVHGGQVSGQLSVAPFCVPWRRVRFLASAGEQVVLLEYEGDRLCPEGDGFTVHLEGAAARVLAEGPEALAEWERLATRERLGLVGLTMGVIDRSWRIALDALCAGKKQDHLLANEQVAQFQLADNDIERLAMDHLALDVAIDGEKGRNLDHKLALVRYSTSAAAERCAQRAQHLAALFLPSFVPIARWLALRAHQLSVFGPAREYEVRSAASGLAAGLSLE